MNLQMLADRLGVFADLLAIFGVVFLLFALMGLAERALEFALQLFCHYAFPPGGRLKARQDALLAARSDATFTPTRGKRRTFNR